MTHIPGIGMTGVFITLSRLKNSGKFYSYSLSVSDPVAKGLGIQALSLSIYEYDLNSSFFHRGILLSSGLYKIDNRRIRMFIDIKKAQCRRAI